MPAPLFDPNKCDNIGSVPSLDFDFVSECSIAAPPPPIFDCTPPLVPREPPIPCPEFQGSVHLQTGYAVCGGPTTAGGALTVTPTDNAPCRFLIDLDLDIPIPAPPCPTIKEGEVTVNAGFAACVPEAGGTLTITKTDIPATCSEPGTCEFTIDLDLDIPIPQAPCPTINEGEVTVTTGYSDAIGPPGGAITIHKVTTPGDCNTPDACDFTIDLDINVPVPRVPCPTINTTGTLTYDPTVEEPVLAFTVDQTVTPGTGNTPDTCQFDINLDLELPVPGCPVINGVLTTYLTEPGETVGSIAITPKSTTAGVCEFDLEIELGIPRAPCPELTATGSVWVNSEATAPQLTFTVAPGSAANSVNCALDFDLQLELPPIPKLPPCPVFTQRTVALTTGATPGATIAIVPTPASDKEDGCDYAIDLGIKFPVACQPIFKAGSTIITTPGQNEPTLTLGVTNPGPNDCNYNLQFDWIFPAERPCPLITAPAPVSFGQSPTNNYSGQLTVTPIAPVGRGACQYELGLALYVPPPQTVCVPEVTVSGQVIVTPGRDEPVLKVNTTTSGPSSCLNKDYEVYLELPPQTKVVEGEHNVTPGECGDDPTLALNIEQPEGTLNEYVVTIVGTIPDCSVCCPVESEVDIAPDTPTYPFMAAPPANRPRMFLISSSAARTFTTGDTIRFVVNFTTIRNRGAKPLEALQLEFSFDEDANITRLADLVEPAPDVVATAFYFEYEVLEDDAACELWINKIIDPRQVPYYSKLANSANRKVVVPFARKRITATVNSGCSSSSGSSTPSSSSGDSSRFSSASSLLSSLSSSSRSSDSSSGVSSSSVSSSSDSSRSSRSSSSSSYSASSDSSASSRDSSRSSGSNDSSSSQSSASTNSSDSSGVSGSSMQSSTSGGSCPPAPSCPPCYYAFPAGYDGDCVLYECLYVTGPDCPGDSSSSSSSELSSGSSFNAPSSSSIGSAASSSGAPSSSAVGGSSSSSETSSSNSSDSSAPSDSTSSNSSGPAFKWKCVQDSSSSNSGSSENSSSSSSSSNSFTEPCGGVNACEWTAISGPGGIGWVQTTPCFNGCNCAPPIDPPTTPNETYASYCFQP